ncbi:hypothetical protein FRC08_001451 [Ceratobasidium sp. 394]|nr:hypothetical protein FRC08_001451 [Ceratobasidium sp. 394]
MGKATRAIKCPYCPRVCMLRAGLNSHFSQSPRCGAKRLKELNKLTLPKPPPPPQPKRRNRRRSRSRQTSPVTPPSPATGRIHLGGSAEGSPNHAQEPSDTERAKSPEPQRPPRVSVEEVQDEDLPNPPKWGPHPYAKPTRQSLFPEPHPDPTAGVASSFHPIEESPPPLYDTKLAEPDIFREAHWIANLPINRELEEEYFHLPRVSDKYPI